MWACPTTATSARSRMATEVLADRWTPLILRELVLGNTRFNDIARGLPGISRSLLVQRLRHLERKGVIETWPSPTGRGSEYHLTPGRQGPRAGPRWRSAGGRSSGCSTTSTRRRRRRHADVVDAPPGRRQPAAADAGRHPVRPHRAEAQSIWMVLDQRRGVGLPPAPGLRHRRRRDVHRPRRLRRVFTGSTRGGRPWRPAASRSPDARSWSTRCRAGSSGARGRTRCGRSPSHSPPRDVGRDRAALDGERHELHARPVDEVRVRRRVEHAPRRRGEPGTRRPSRGAAARPRRRRWPPAAPPRSVIRMSRTASAMQNAIDVV